jgi:hypothetical protein
MATIKTILESGDFENKCVFCGYKEYILCLTAHHVFPKGYFRPQPQFDRKDRYLVLCPTCHVLLHIGIFVKDGKQIIIKLVSLIYKIPYEEDTKGL